jgi:hypothetical protein
MDAAKFGCVICLRRAELLLRCIELLCNAQIQGNIKLAKWLTKDSHPAAALATCSEAKGGASQT